MSAGLGLLVAGVLAGIIGGVLVYAIDWAFGRRHVKEGEK